MRITLFYVLQQGENKTKEVIEHFTFAVGQ